MIIINEDHGDADPPIGGSTPLDGGLVTASEPHNFTYFDTLAFKYIELTPFWNHLFVLTICV